MRAGSSSYPSPRALLDRYGFRAKRSWGQNFLGDEQILDHIVRLAVESPGERVVELGAGLGHLTARLLARSSAIATWRWSCVVSSAIASRCWRRTR